LKNLAVIAVIGIMIIDLKKYLNNYTISIVNLKNYIGIVFFTIIVIIVAGHKKIDEFLFLITQTLQWVSMYYL